MLSTENKINWKPLYLKAHIGVTYLNHTTQHCCNYSNKNLLVNALLVLTTLLGFHAGNHGRSEHSQKRERIEIWEGEGGELPSSPKEAHMNTSSKVQGVLSIMVTISVWTEQTTELKQKVMEKMQTWVYRCPMTHAPGSEAKQPIHA